MRLFTQGMIRKDGAKMSKSKGNVVAPEAILDRQGADALRLAHCHVKPPSDDVDWEDFGLDGCYKFLGRLWRLAIPGGAEVLAKREGGAEVPTKRESADEAIIKSSHKLVDRVTKDFERWAFNTAVAGCMEFLNELYLYVQSVEGGYDEKVLDSALDKLLLVMSPMIPHVTAELWNIRNGGHIHKEPWPEADKKFLEDDLVTLIIQVNGKVRDKVQVSADISESQVEELALNSEKKKSYLGEGKIKRSILRPPQIGQPRHRGQVASMFTLENL